MPKQSLAAQAGALAEVGLQLPEIFQKPQEQVTAWNLSPYITFAHSKRADEWLKIQSQLGSVEEGDMYLIEGGHVHHLEPAKLAMVCCKQYWAHANAAGELLSVSFTEMPKPFNERIEAAVFVYLEDACMPANIQFRTTRCPAAKILADTLAEAGTEAWGAKSQAHKETLLAPQPFMRYFGSVTLGPKRTSKATGLPYRTTQCAIHPTGIAEWRLMKQFCDDPSAQDRLTQAAELFNKRLEEAKHMEGR